MTNTIRRVTPNDEKPDAVDNSGVVSVREKKWRWGSKLPATPGYYAVRPKSQRQNQAVLYIADIVRGSRFADTEFSDRTVDWPLEEDASEADGQFYSHDWVRYQSGTHEPQEDDWPDGDNAGRLFWIGMASGSFIATGIFLIVLYLVMRH